jgi:Na+/H+-translocating membrane pyrophosphatase
VINILILAYKPGILWALGPLATKSQIAAQVRLLFSFISGYGMGGSNVALFGRVGGGIYTKAADVGADLAGKVGEHLEEDSPLNPGTIADNVGDNVGDIAGMAADLFGSMASSTCSALVVSSTSWPLIETNDSVYFPLFITACGIVSSFISVQFVHLPKLSVPTKLRIQLVVSAILTSGLLIPILWTLPKQLDISFAGEYYKASRG